MGIIWYFEVLAFFVDKDSDHKWLYLGDILNMMQVFVLFSGKENNQSKYLYYIQGVWVFLTFVCKRNVLQVITKGRDELYSVVKNKVKQTSIGSGVFQYIP